MINIDEVYPNPEQHSDINDSIHCIANYNLLQSQFEENRKGSIIPYSDLLKEDINKFDRLINSNNIQIYGYEEIWLDKLFWIGWKGFTLGKENHPVPNYIWKLVPEIRMQISEKFKDTDPPLGFFESFSSLSILVFYVGMGHAKYYYWLKNELEQLERTPTRLPRLNLTFKTNLSNDKLQKLFTLLKESGFISPDTKENIFLHVFGKPLPDGEVFEPVKWIKKSKNKSVNKSSLVELFQLLDKKLVPDKSFFAFAFENFCTEE